MKSPTLKPLFRQPLFFILSVTVLLMLIVSGLTVSSNSKSKSGDITVRAAGRGNPWIALQDGWDLPTTYQGQAARVMKPGEVRPLTLASADFNEDGVADLVSGYARSKRAIVTLHLGNTEALAATSDQSLNRAAKDKALWPLLSTARTFKVPESVDFLAAGDFNQDGHQDVITAALGSQTLYLLVGDGSGSFSSAEAIGLPGAVTAMAAGEINQEDKLADVVIGILGPQGSQVLVYEGAAGGLRGQPVAYALPAEVSALAMGQLDDEAPVDLAVAAGTELIIIPGQNRLSSPDSANPVELRETVIDRRAFPFLIRSMAMGNFIPDDQSRTDIAVLAEDGTVHVLVNKNAGEKVEAWEGGKLSVGPWTGATQLVRASLSSLPSDDLLVADPGSNQVHILGGGFSTSGPLLTLLASLDMETAPAALLPMQLSAGDKQSLVMLRKNQLCPTVVIAESTASSDFSTQAVQTVLVPGDIAFSGFIANAAVPDQFSFVLLTAVTSTTVIKFTDFGWRNGSSSFNSAPATESELTLTVGSNLPAGTEIIIDGTTATVAGGGSAGALVHTVGAGVFNPTLSFTTSGDQIFAYQGTFAAPVFIAGIHMNVEVGTTAAAWDPAAAGILGSTSEKPPALTTGTNALWFTTEHDNARYDCALGNITTAPLALASLNNPANWLTNTVGPPAFTLPTGCNYLGVLSSPPVFTLHPPASTIICAGTGTIFTIAASGAVSYQWQVDNGGGFANLSNDASYSGVTSVTLTITNATVALNGFIYRCVATNASGSTNSNNAPLNVIALPVNPTLLAKTPATVSVADGTPVSATFNAGSGGTTCTDDYRLTTNGGSSYSPYTPGGNISTTGLAAGAGYVFIEGRRAGCASLCQNSYIVLAAWYVTPLPAGATTLNAGDIAFSGYTSTVTDEFSFVLLKNIGPGTVINFTDTGWLSANVFGAAEQTVTWTSNAAYPAGTEIKITGTTATLAAGGSAGTVTGTPLSLITSGDQVLAYQGAAATPTFISAIHMNVEVGSTAAAWDGAVVSNNASALPTGLTTGVNCIWIGTAGDLASEFNNARYGACAGPGTLGPITTLRAALNNQANWIRDDLTPPGFTIPTGCLYFGLGAVPTITLQPLPASVCEGTSTSFTITALGAISYQWQVDQGTGFNNLANDATYSGVISNTLNINATPTGLNGYLYRCVATNVSGSTNSNSALLTVTALPVMPTLLVKTPAGLSVADGTPVSATFNPGSGGTGCSDDFRYTTDGGVTYLPYTPGSNISTTGLAAASGFVFIEGRRANCSAGCQGVYSVLAAWRVMPLPVAATTLNAGDIAFSGYTSTVTDEFSFVLLRNIGPGTTINFTDNGWLSTNVFGTGEQTVTWTAPAGGLPGGTEIKIAGLVATRSGPGAAGTVAGTALNLISTGDQVLAYRGTAASPTFISAIHMNVEVGSTAAAWDGAVVSNNASALPTGLTTGVNCIWIGTAGVPASEFNNSRYGNCSGPGVLGPLTALRTALNNQANWISDNNTPPDFTLPTGCNYLSAICPTITGTMGGGGTICAGGSTNVTVTISGGVGPYSVTLNNGGGMQTGASPLTFSVSPGTTTTYAVASGTDANGCSITGSGSATVTLETQPPTVTVGTIASCYTTVAAAEAAALAATSATDNCPGALVETASTVGTCSAVITVTTTDGAGNATAITYNTRIDNTAPTVTVGTIASCYTTVTAAEAAALAATSATDNCPGALTETASTVGTCSAVVTVTTTDGCGNATAVTYNTRIDNTAPTVTVGTINSGYPTVAAAEAAALAATSATDNCPGALVETASTVGTCSAVVTVTTTDGCGNATAVTYNTRIDIQPPTITCPANITQPSDKGACTTVVTFAAPTVTDNCPAVGTPTCTPASGAVFPKGVTTVTCSVTDASSNTASCTFTVTVADTQNPAVTCPANVSIVSNVCVTNAYTPPVGSDNCPGVSVVCVPPPSTCFPIGTTTVTCTATDTSNNMASCSFTVTIIPCTISCPANITRANDPNQCGAVVTFAPTATAGCGTVTCSPASGSLFPKGTTTVTCNTTAGPSCSFTVTVTDAQAPTITCPANITAAITGVGSCAVVNYPAPVATDNCAVASVVCNPPSGSCFPVGTTTVSCVATDTAGNTASCSFTVTTFDICLQDDSNPGTVVLMNSLTGAYRFCCNGSVFTGVGTVKTRGSTVTLEAITAGRRVSAKVDKTTFVGTGYLQQPPGTTLCTITDRDTRNNSCICQ